MFSDLKQEMQIFEREKVSDNDKSLANRKPSLRIVDSNQMVPPNSTSPLKSKLNQAYRRTRHVTSILSCIRSQSKHKSDE